MTSGNVKYHQSDEEYFRLAENSLKNGMAEGRLSASDVELIRKYVRRLKSTVSAGRYAKIISMLCSCRRYFHVEFSQATEDDFLDALADMKYAKHESGKNAGQPYRQNTVVDWQKVCRRFFRFLSESGLTTVPLKTIQEIKIGGFDRHTKGPDDVLTPEEINKIIDAARTPKYKAFFGCLYETGGRSIEVARLQWKDVEVKEWGAVLHLRDYKAGSSPNTRVVPVVVYAKYLFDLKSQYRGNPSGDAYVFTTPQGEPIQYGGIMKALNQFVRAAGINRHISLHQFRHTRITHALESGMSETLAKKVFWGNQSTQMIEVYSHLTTSDVEDAFLKMGGVEIEEKQVNRGPQPIQCPTCHKVMPPGSRFCSRCCTALTADAIEEVRQGEQIISDMFEGLSDEKKLKVVAFLQSH